MNNNFKLMMVVLVITVLSSCGRSSAPDSLVENPVAPSFIANIDGMKTRMSDNQWDKNDEIGIYMLKDSKKIIHKNVRFVSDGTKSFGGPVLKYPSDGSSVDFLAYYPYTSNIDSGIYKINLSDQSVPSKIDFLYSNNASKKNNKDRVIDLNFKHKLCMLRFTKDKITSNIDAMNFEIKVVVDGEFSLLDGTLDVGDKLNTFKVDFGHYFILLPGTDVIVEFSLNGNKVKKIIKGELVSGMKTTIPVNIDDNSNVYFSESDISDWEDKDGKELDVNFGDD